MASATERVLEDLQRVIGELESIVRTAGDAAGGRAEDLSDGLKEKFELAHDRISDVQQSAERNLRRGLRIAGRHVRDNPWESVGTVAAVAFIAGLVLGRRD